MKKLLFLLLLAMPLMGFAQTPVYSEGHCASQGSKTYRLNGTCFISNSDMMIISINKNRYPGVTQVRWSKISGNTSLSTTTGFSAALYPTSTPGDATTIRIQAVTPSGTITEDFLLITTTPDSPNYQNQQKCN